MAEIRTMEKDKGLPQLTEIKRYSESSWIRCYDNAKNDGGWVVGECKVSGEAYSIVVHDRSSTPSYVKNSDLENWS